MLLSSCLVDYLPHWHALSLQNPPESTRLKVGNALTRIAYKGPPYTKPPKLLSRIRPLKMDELYEEKEEKQAHAAHTPSADHDADDESEMLVF